MQIRYSERLTIITSKRKRHFRRLGLINREARRTRGAASLGGDGNLAGRRARRHVGFDFGIGDRREGAGFPFERHFCRLLQARALNGDRGPRRPALRSKARNGRQHVECLRAGQRGRACGHGHGSGQRPCGNCSGDECRAREPDGCCFCAAELDHRRTFEALPEDANLRAFLAGGGLCFHERLQTYREAEERPIIVRAAEPRCPVEGPIGGLYQTCGKVCPIRAVPVTVCFSTKTVESLQRAIQGYFEDRPRSVGPRVCCPIEVSIGGLDERPIGVCAVREIEAVQCGQHATWGHSEDRAVWDAVVPAVDGCPVEVSIGGMDQLVGIRRATTTGSVAKGVQRGQHATRSDSEDRAAGDRLICCSV